MKVISSADVVSWNNRSECSSSISSGELQATKSISRYRGFASITITPSLNTSVDAGGVASPEFDISISNRLACGGVDDVDIQMCDGTLLASEHVGADQLANDP